MHDIASMSRLVTYMEQIQCAAAAANVDLKEIAKEIGYENNIYRWMTGRFHPRQAQAERLLDAVSRKFESTREV